MTDREMLAYVKGLAEAGTRDIFGTVPSLVRIAKAIEEHMSQHASDEEPVRRFT